MEGYLLVMLGGAIGVALRYGLAVWLQNWLHVGGFPWWTFAASVSGSFAIGLVMAGFLNGQLSGNVRLFLAVGILGGFTTFSSFSYETLGLLQRGEWWRAAAYVAGSVVLGFVAVLVAYRLVMR